MSVLLTRDTPDLLFYLSDPGPKFQLLHDKLQYNDYNNSINIKAFPFKLVHRLENTIDSTNLKFCINFFIIDLGPPYELRKRNLVANQNAEKLINLKLNLYSVS